MDIILHLGGNINRSYKAAEVATNFPLARIVISTEGPINQALDIYKEKGITKDRIDLDFNAWDTVTNFTETKAKINLANPKKLYVVTDEFHMRRAMIIAKICYFDSALELVPCSSTYNAPDRKEANSMIRYDAVRTGIWKATGHLFYDAKIKADRWPGIQAEAQAAKTYCW